MLLGNWTLQTANAPWQSRSGCSAVLFNNILYLIGGHLGPNSDANDVWTTNISGIEWTVLLEFNNSNRPTTQFSPRYSQTTSIIGNKMILIGGWGKFLYLFIINS